MSDPAPSIDLTDLAKALEREGEPDLLDQGDIAADDAGATAMAERVTQSAGVQGGAEDEA